jgi:hypothetical protein
MSKHKYNQPEDNLNPMGFLLRATVAPYTWVDHAVQGINNEIE